jgi:hypothetical protein
MAGEAKLRIEVMADGTARVSGELAGVAAATARVGTASAGASRVLGGLGKVTHGVSRMMGGMFRSLTSLGGMIGIGLGGAAIKMAIDNLASFDAGLTTLQHSAGASRTEMQAVGAAITDMAAKSGRPKTELLGAVDAAVDLGMKMQDVVAILQDASNWARLLGVDTTSATVALASMGKLAGPGMDRKRLMAITDIGVGASGMDEGAALQLIGRLAPMMRGQGLQGEQGVTDLMRMFAGAGQFMTNPKEMVGGVRALVNTFKDSAGRLAKAGVDTSSVGAMFRSLAGIAHNDAKQLQRLKLSDSLVSFVTAAGEGYDQIVKFDEALENADPAKFAAELEAAGASQAASWDKIKVQAAEIFAPIAGNILQWLANPDNQAAMKGAFENLVAIVSEVAHTFGGLIDDISAIFGGPTSAELRQLTQERKEGKARADRMGELREQWAAAKTPQEKARIAGQMAEVRERDDKGAGTAFWKTYREHHPEATARDMGLGWYGEMGRMQALAPGVQGVVNALTPRSVAAGARAAAQVLQNIIHIHVDPETVHAETDARNGQRTETTVTQERGRSTQPER